MLFTPINNVAYAALRPEEAQQAAGLINLSRQLGGSFGIAWLITYVTNRTQLHRVDLLQNVDPGNPLVQQRLQGMVAMLQSRGYGPTGAVEGAYRMLDGQVQQQATMLSFNDGWRLILLAFIIVSPAVLLLRRPKGGAGMAVDAH
jgi:DHA2 family multidrug resistance protein